MDVKQFLQLHGVKNRTPLVKVLSDIIGTTRYDEVIMTFLDNNGVGLKKFEN